MAENIWNQLLKITEILAPSRIPEIASVFGRDWRLKMGPVDLNAELITIQCQDHMVAEITCSEDGRLLVAVYRPFDAGSAAILANLGLNPYPEGGAAMRNNKWEYALDASASSFRHMTATETGQSYKILLGRGTGDLSRLFLNFRMA